MSGNVESVRAEINRLEVSPSKNESSKIYKNSPSVGGGTGGSMKMKTKKKGGIKKDY